MHTAVSSRDVWRCSTTVVVRETNVPAEAASERVPPAFDRELAELRHVLMSDGVV